MSDLLTPRFVYVGIRDALDAIPRLTEMELGIEVIFNTTSDLWPKIKWDVLLGLADDFSEVHLPVACHGRFTILRLRAATDTSRIIPANRSRRPSKPPGLSARP